MITSEQAAIRRLLELWARCQASGNGYPGACSIAYAADGGPGVNVMGSKPPRGVEVPAAVRAVQQAMERGQAAGIGPQIAVLRAIYTRTENKTLEQIAAAHGMTSRTMRSWRTDGERWLAAHVRIAD